MQASDYPITFPYGDTDYPYGPTGYAGPYHRGDDRAMPDGTPILVNGVQIGLSGHSGEVTGPHLHIGRFVNGADTNPQGQGLTLATPATVTDVSSDDTNGNYVAVNDAAGVRWVYLHMSEQTASVGQVINETTNGGDDMATAEMITEAALYMWGVNPSQDDLNKYIGKPLNTVYEAMNVDPRRQNIIGKVADYDHLYQTAVDLQEQLRVAQESVTDPTAQKALTQIKNIVDAAVSS